MPLGQKKTAYGTFKKVPGATIEGTRLDFNEKFNKPIKVGLIPEGITEVILDKGAFNKEIKADQFPKSLIKMKIGGDFSKLLDDGTIPRVTHLDLNLWWGYKLHDSITIPDSVTHLTYNGKDLSKIPLSVTHLKITRHIEKDDLVDLTDHNNITHMDIKLSMDAPLIQLTQLPKSVTHLTLDIPSRTGKIPKGFIPKGIVELKFGPNTFMSFGLGTIPNTVKSLEFAEADQYSPGSFNTKFMSRVLPDSIEYLNLGYRYNHPIFPGILPSNVKYIKFGGLFDYPLEDNAIPESVKQIEFDEDYSHFIPERLIKRGIKILPDNLIESLKERADDIKREAAEYLEKIETERRFHMMYQEWNDFISMAEDATVSREDKLVMLKKLYYNGYPIPVEWHRASILDAGDIDEDILTAFSVRNQFHKSYYDKLSKKLKELINSWIYDMHYSEFNTFISELNEGDKESVSKTMMDIGHTFLGEYKTATDAYKAFRKAIMNAPRMDREVFAWRGMHGMEDMCMNARVGSYVGLSRFSAASVAMEVSCKFAHNGILLMIELPPNSPFLNITYAKSSEPEFLLPDRCVFEVIDRKPYKAVCDSITCSELVHVKLVGVYTLDRTDFEIYLGGRNIPEIRIDTIY